MTTKNFGKKAVATIILCSIAGIASAGNRGHDYGNWVKPTKRINAPEIDPASASSALTLLLGGLTVLRSRMRKK